MSGKSKAQALDAITRYPTYILLASSLQLQASNFQLPASVFRISHSEYKLPRRCAPRNGS